MLGEGWTYMILGSTKESVEQYTRMNTCRGVATGAG